MYEIIAIIPLSNTNTIFKQPWPDFLMPIGNNINLFDQALWSAAMMPICQSIWIVGHNLPKICRQTYGDWVNAPNVKGFMKEFSEPSVKRFITKRIPIYYVPLHPDDIGKRDGVVWSVLWGAHLALTFQRDLTKSISATAKIMMISPFSIFNYADLQKECDTHGYHSQQKKYNIFTSASGKTIKDLPLNLPFIFRSQELPHLVDLYSKLDSGYINKSTQEILPIEQRWSGRNMTFHDLFQTHEFSALEDRLVELKNFFNIASWSEYHEYLKSPHSKSFFRPEFRKDKRFSPVFLKSKGTSIRTWKTVRDEKDAEIARKNEA